MILFIYGTTAEVIKLAPVIRRVHRRGSDCMSICTGQHVGDISQLVEQFELPAPDIWLATGHGGQNLRRNIEIPGWLLKVGGGFLSSYREIKAKRGKKEQVLTIVHGDTFTTLLGALMGLGLRTIVGHVEAGVRSFDWRNPFPEELIRRSTSRLARIHFAPGDIAVRNLARSRGAVINTVFNTVKDSLDLIEADVVPVVSLPSRFGIVSLHRFELINDRKRLLDILSLLGRYSESTPLLFVDHSITAAKIEQFGLDGFFNEETFIRMPKLRYFEFVSLLKRSEFSVTDSGGVQQESFYLNHPCLVHREKVETFDGVGANVVVSGMDLEIVKDFLADPRRFKVEDLTLEASPSDLIVEHLEREGYI